MKQRVTGAIVVSTLVAIFVPMLFDDGIEHTDDSPYEIPEIPMEIKVPPEPPPENLEVIVEEPLNPLASPSVDEPLVVPDPGNTVDSDGMLDMSGQPAIAPANGKQPVGSVTAWIVQVGSFGSYENADSLVGKLKDGGFPAFLEKTTEQGKKFFRVRVGPEVDRSRAEQQRKDIEKKFDVKTIVVSYP